MVWQPVRLDRLTTLELLALLRELEKLEGGRPSRTIQKETQRLRSVLEYAIADSPSES